MKECFHFKLYNVQCLNYIRCADILRLQKNPALGMKAEKRFGSRKIASLHYYTKAKLSAKSHAKLKFRHSGMKRSLIVVIINLLFARRAGKYKPNEMQLFCSS